MNKEKALEFETNEGHSEKEATRSCFRVPVRASDRLSIRIGKTVYPVVNMQGGGIAFRTRAAGDYFPVEKERINATLTLEDATFDIQAQVMHVSEDGEEFPLCGLRFVDLDQITAQKLSAFYEFLRGRLLTNKGG